MFTKRYMMAKKAKKSPETPFNELPLEEKIARLQATATIIAPGEIDDPKEALFLQILALVITGAKSEGIIGTAPETTVTIPADLTRLVDQLVKQRFFGSRQDAAEELLWRGYGDYNDKVVSKKVKAKETRPEEAYPSCGQPNEGTNYCDQCGFLMMVGYCGVCGRKMAEADHLCPICQALTSEFSEIPPRDIQIYFDVVRKLLRKRGATEGDQANNVSRSNSHRERDLGTIKSGKVSKRLLE